MGWTKFECMKPVSPLGYTVTVYQTDPSAPYTASETVIGVPTANEPMMVLSLCVLASLRRRTAPPLEEYTVP